MKSWDKYELDELAKILFQNAVVSNAEDLRKKFQSSYDDLRKKLEVVSETVRNAKMNGWDEIIPIWNLAGFILTASLDAKISCENLIFLSGYGKKELQIRNLCVLIYEASEDLEQLLGRELFDELRNLEISLQTVQALKAAKKELSRFRKEHQASLKLIRKIVGAHRDHDFLVQLETIEGLSGTAFLKVVFRFDDILSGISIPIQNILNEGTENFVRKMRRKA